MYDYQFLRTRLLNLQNSFEYLSDCYYKLKIKLFALQHGDVREEYKARYKR